MMTDDTANISIGHYPYGPGRNWAQTFRDIGLGYLAFAVATVSLVGVCALTYLSVDDRLHRPHREDACAELGARAGGAKWELMGTRECLLETLDGVKITMMVD